MVAGIIAFDQVELPGLLVNKPLVEIVSRRLDVRAILLNQLNAFSNQGIEILVMETAEREIRAIVRFGATIVLIAGIVQSIINFCESQHGGIFLSDLTRRLS
jgi:hypothetical protein